MKTDDFITLLASDNAMAQQLGKREAVTLAAGILAALAVVVAAFVATMGLRTGLGEAVIRNAVIRKEAITLTLAGSGLVMAWWLTRPTAARSLLWLAPVLVLGTLTAWEIAGAPSAAWTARMMGTNAAACLAMIPVLSILPLAAILYGLRHRAPASAARAGAAAGFAASGIGATVYALHCTDDSMLFVGVWYALATCVMVGLGIAAGGKYLRW